MNGKKINSQKLKLPSGKVLKGKERKLFETSKIKLDYFFTPTELKNKTFPTDKRIKLGGMVLKGSVERVSSNISFIVTDYTNSINVEYEGILPDLFKEDSGVVVLGYLNNQTVYAEEVLAKHDENYMPPNIELRNDN